MLEWICQLIATRLHCGGGGPEDITFISALRKKFVRQVPASLKSSMITFLCRLDLMVGTEANQLENLDAIGTTESWSG